MFANENLDTYNKVFKALIYLLKNKKNIKIEFKIVEMEIETTANIKLAERVTDHLIIEYDDESIFIDENSDKLDDNLTKYITSHFNTSNIKVYQSIPILLNCNKPRIVTAACKYGDVIIVGARHYSKAMHTQLRAFDEESEVRMLNRGEVVQGFVDQFDKFYDRKEALKIALENNQINMNRFKTWPMDELFSEDLH